MANLLPAEMVEGFIVQVISVVVGIGVIFFLSPASDLRAGEIRPVRHRLLQ